MARKRNKTLITGEFFTWRIGQRKGVWAADGRSNPRPAGRHSLGTKDYDEAIENLRQLDRVMAVEMGLADPAVLHVTETNELLLDAGVKQYLDHCRRPRVFGGVSEKSSQRYAAVFDKAVPFLRQRGIASWNFVTKHHVQRYASWLDAESYAYRTEFFEITVIKQAFNFWIEQNLLPSECRLKISMTKPTDTDTYCYRREEVEAMVELCRAGRSLGWLGDVLVGLACTGLRISELANMRWSNIDLAVGMISLVDESRSKRAKNRAAQTTKSRRGRFFPIHTDLRTVLERLHRENSQGRVFRAEKGGILRPDNVRHILINRVINPLTKKFPSAEDEVGFKDGRLHSLRHYFCSICANGNVPEQVVMRWLGHRNSDMVKRYYHLHDEEAQRQMARIDFGQFGAS